MCFNPVYALLNALMGYTWEVFTSRRRLGARWANVERKAQCRRCCCCCFCCHLLLLLCGVVRFLATRRQQRLTLTTSALRFQLQDHSLHECKRILFSERELTFTFAICYRPSVCRLSVCLSSVTLVRPTQAVQIFGNISTAFGTLAIH